MSAESSFVRALMEELARKGRSRKDLAQELGCTDSNVAQMFSGDRTKRGRPQGMHLHTAERLAEGLGCGVFVLLTQPGAETVIAEWQEEASRKGLSLWDWLTAQVERSWRGDTFDLWRSEGFHTRVANALANARIRSWSELEALGRSQLLAMRDLGKTGVREIEERLTKRRKETAPERCQGQAAAEGGRNHEEE